MLLEIWPVSSCYVVIIYNPKGIYYGGTIAAPVLRDIYDNVLPYLEKQEK